MQASAKLKSVAIILLVAGVLGAGAGIGLLAQRAASPTSGDAPEIAQPALRAKAVIPDEDLADQFRDSLRRFINLEKGIDANTPSRMPSNTSMTATT